MVSNMSWQDIVFTVGTWMLIVALLPTVYGKNKPSVSTACMYGTVLLAFTLTYYSLSLWLSTISTGISAALWYLIGFQGLRLKK